MHTSRHTSGATALPLFSPCEGDQEAPQQHESDPQEVAGTGTGSTSNQCACSKVPLCSNSREFMFSPLRKDQTMSTIHCGLAVSTESTLLYTLNRKAAKARALKICEKKMTFKVSREFHWNSNWQLGVVSTFLASRDQPARCNLQPSSSPTLARSCLACRCFTTMLKERSSPLL